MRVIDRPDMRALTPLGAMDEARAELKAYKRKAKAQRDNWKRKTMDYRIMLEVFRGCIEIKTIPAIASPCHKKVIELLEGKQTPNKAGEGKI